MWAAPGLRVGHSPQKDTPASLSFLSEAKNLPAVTLNHPSLPLVCGHHKTTVSPVRYTYRRGQGLQFNSRRRGPPVIRRAWDPSRRDLEAYMGLGTRNSAGLGVD